MDSNWNSYEKRIWRTKRVGLISDFKKAINKKEPYPIGWNTVPNSSKKSITISDENKREVRYYIENISDIYKYKNELLSSLDKYLEKVDA